MKKTRATLILAALWLTVALVLPAFAAADSSTVIRLSPSVTPEPEVADPFVLSPVEAHPTEAPAALPTFPPQDFSDKNYALPIDFTNPVTPKSSNFISEDVYRDETLQVNISTGRKDGCTYWVADIVVSDPSQLRTLSAGGFDSSSQMDAIRLCKRSQAVLAINGDFFASSERRGKGFIIRQGEMFRNNLDTAGRWDSKMMDVLLIDEDGDFHVLFHPEKDTIYNTVDGKRILNAFSFGPVLVHEGQVVKDYAGSDRWIDMSTDGDRQRICLCQVDTLHYMVICCAGPSNGNSGMSLPKFAQLAVEQGVKTAYNLDGGDSTILFFNGNRINGRNVSKRKLQDIIYFASAEAD